jgi:hypothetical protein
VPDLWTLFWLVAAVGVFVLIWRHLATETAARYRTFELRFARDFDAAGAAHIVRSLGGLSAPWWGCLLGSPAVIVEVRADQTGIRHLIRIPDRLVAFLTGQLSVAGVRFWECSDEPPEVSTGAEFRRASLLVPLTTEPPGAVATGLLAAFQPLEAGQVVVMQSVVTPTRSPHPAELNPAAPWWRQVIGLPPPGPSPAAAEAVRTWQREPTLAASIRIGVVADTPAASRQLLSRLSGALQLTRSRQAALSRRLLPTRLIAARINRGTLPINFPARLRASEAAAILALPSGSVVAGLRLAGTRQLPPPPALPRAGRVLGDATYPGAERPVAIGYPDAASRHLWAVGSTGTGKSTLMCRAALDDAASGAGLCLIDPVKGDLIADFIERLPAHRADDLIVLDAADLEWPTGFNPLAGHRSPELAADGMLHIFRHLARTRWGGSWGPRLEDTMRNSLISLARANLTLCELPALLLDSAVRHRIVAGLDDPLGVGPFWNWYEGLSDGEREQVAAPVINKVRPFTVLPHVRNIIGQRRSPFTLPDVLKQGKILCVSLPRGVIGEDAATLLGASVLASLWRAVLGRAALASPARRPFYVYVDEWQDVTALPSSFGEALAASRGLGVGWALANQHARQLPADLLAAALANCRSKVAFQLGGADAALFAKEFAPYLTADDLTGLAPFEAVAAVAAGAATAPPLTIRTRPAPPPTGQGVALRTAARRRFGRARGEVEAELRSRLDGATLPVAVGTRRRP